MGNRKRAILNERQVYVLHTMRMRLTDSQALIYMKNNNHEISNRTLTRDKKKINNKKLDRLYAIAQYGFEDQHLERIDKCELIEMLQWQQFAYEKDPNKKSQILDRILKLQPYLSSYYEATKDVMDDLTNIPKNPDVSKQAEEETGTNKGTRP